MTPGVTFRGFAPGRGTREVPHERFRAFAGPAPSDKAGPSPAAPRPPGGGRRTRRQGPAGCGVGKLHARPAPHTGAASSSAAIGSTVIGLAAIGLTAIGSGT